MKYELKASKNGKDFQHMATFYEGEPDRHGVPFDVERAVIEAQSFKDSRRGREYPHIQLVITI